MRAGSKLAQTSARRRPEWARLKTGEIREAPDLVSETGALFDGGLVEPQVDALASVLEVARGRASAEEIAKLAEIQAQLDQARRQFETMLALPAVEAEHANGALRNAIKSKLLAHIMQWRSRRGRMQARAYFDAVIAPFPKPLRPFWHEVRQANLRFYNALRSAASKEQTPFDDLFEKMPGAQGLGGRLAGKPIDPAEAVARVERKRKLERERRRAIRAGSGPR
jgi:hypothetical protein